MFVFFFNLILGFLGDLNRFRNGWTLIIKNHMVLKSNMDVYDSAILLVRNPYKAHIAEYNRKKTSDKLGYAKVDDFFSKGNANLALFVPGGGGQICPPIS